MITLYFSGTGNSKFIAERFSQTMAVPCHSIEEEIDFKDKLAESQTIAVCYPIYGSCVPRIMREFVTANQSAFAGKNLIIFSTQMMFSGDGARVFTELLEGVSVNVLYAEHFNMPNNICNFFLFPIANSAKILRYIRKADMKLSRTCENIKNGTVKKRGFNTFSRCLGLWTQRIHFGALEKKAENDVRISQQCNVCGKCIKICPMKNLSVTDQRIKQMGHCTLCYRCVNQCPKKAITVFLHTKIKRQYRGIDKLLE